MSNKSLTINNYAQLTKYLILADHKYLNYTPDEITSTLGTDLTSFTPIVDETINDNIDYGLITGYFRIRRPTLRYKVIPARFQVAESALLFKAMYQVMDNPEITRDDFVLFALPGISMGANFEQKVTAVLEYLNQPKQSHIDCVLLDYAYLGTENNLIELVNNHQQLDQDPTYTKILYTSKPFDYLEFITSTIDKIDIHLTDQTSTTLTVATPSCMGITYSYCFLPRKSRIARILKQKRPHWMISDIKRYVPVTQTLIVTPSLLNTNYPEYDLTIPRQDILELNREYIQHITTMDTYRKHLYRWMPWIVHISNHSNPIVRRVGKICHKLLACNTMLSTK